MTWSDQIYLMLAIYMNKGGNIFVLIQYKLGTQVKSDIHFQLSKCYKTCIFFVLFLHVCTFPFQFLMYVNITWILIMQFYVIEQFEGAYLTII